MMKMCYSELIYMSLMKQSHYLTNTEIKNNFLQMFDIVNSHLQYEKQTLFINTLVLVYLSSS